MPLFFTLVLACVESRVPEDADFFEVTVTAVVDECHPDETAGYQETFQYALVFNASSADIYVLDELEEWTLFAVGSATGCDLTYQTVVIGEETEDDGEVKWQLYGQANFDRGDNACVEDETDWQGTETFEIVTSVDETLEDNCEYQMTTSGTYLPPA